MSSGGQGWDLNTKYSEHAESKGQFDATQGLVPSSIDNRSLP